MINIVAHSVSYDFTATNAMSIGFSFDSDCTSVRCIVLAFLTVNFSSGVTPSSSSPRARIASMFSGHMSISVTSRPCCAK